MTEDQSQTTPPGTPSEELPTVDMQQFLEALGQAQIQLQEKEQQYTRLYADFDNFRRRTQREKEEIQGQAVGSTVLALLPALDNFERAKTHIQPETEREEALNNSYQALYKQLLTLMEKLGVVAMDVVGQPFDPKQHEAIAHEPSDLYTEETVVMEFQKGYFLGEKVLRPAMVKVATPQ